MDHPVRAKPTLLDWVEKLQEQRVVDQDHEAVKLDKLGSQFLL